MPVPVPRCGVVQKKAVLGGALEGCSRVLLQPQLQDLFAALLQLLAPFPEARIAVAQALAADKLFLEKSQIARRSQSACTGPPLHRWEGSGSKPGQKWSK